MHRTGIAKLPLHYGKAPEWLTSRMKKLASQVVTLMLDEHGTDDFLTRISDPFWFQALGCVLGYDWHSSGVTTVLTGVLKEAIVPEEHGIAVCGGKGRASRQTPLEIKNAGGKFGLSNHDAGLLCYASRMSAKVDNTAIQAGYQLYHHAFFVAHDGKWAVVQQGMCTQDRTARRYHWSSENLSSYVVEPHSAIVGDARRESALDMTSKESQSCREASVDIAKEPTEKIMRMISPARQKMLDEWFQSSASRLEKKDSVAFLSMPINMNWKAMRDAYEFQPKKLRRASSDQRDRTECSERPSANCRTDVRCEAKLERPGEVLFRLRRKRRGSVSCESESDGRIHSNAQGDSRSSQNRRQREDAVPAAAQKVCPA